MENERMRISEKLLERKLEEVQLAKRLGFRVYKKEEVDKFLMGIAYEAEQFENQFATVVRQLRNIMEERTANVMKTQQPIEINEENFNEAAQQLQAQIDKHQKWEEHLRDMLVGAEEKAERIVEKARMEAQMEMEKTKEKVTMILNDAQEKGDGILREANHKMEEAESYRKKLTEAHERVESDIHTYGEQLITFGEALKEMTMKQSS